MNQEVLSSDVSRPDPVVVTRMLQNDQLSIHRRLDILPAHAKGAVVALGNFDGFHRGHQHLIDKAKQRARSSGRACAVLTFSPHPRRVIRGDHHFELLTSEVKTLAAGSLGVDHYFEQRFDHTISRMGPHQFVENILVKQLGAHAILVGDDFSFGAGKSGNAQSLIDIARGFDLPVNVLGRVKDAEGTIYSSTQIRRCIEAGDFISATALLGRYWQTSGLVSDPGGLASMQLGDVVRPREGEYLARVSTLGGGGRILPTQAFVMVRIPPSRETIAIPGVDGLEAGTRVLVEFVRSI